MNRDGTTTRGNTLQAIANSICEQGADGEKLGAWLKATAAALLARYPQYHGYHDDWKVGVITTDVATKGGRSWDCSDVVLYRDPESVTDGGHGFYTGLSLRREGAHVAIDRTQLLTAEDFGE